MFSYFKQQQQKQKQQSQNLSSEQTKQQLTTQNYSQISLSSQSLSALLRQNNRNNIVVEQQDQNSLSNKKSKQRQQSNENTTTTYQNNGDVINIQKSVNDDDNDDINNNNKINNVQDKQDKLQQQQQSLTLSVTKTPTTTTKHVVVSKDNHQNNNNNINENIEQQQSIKKIPQKENYCQKLKLSLDEQLCIKQIRNILTRAVKSDSFISTLNSINNQDKSKQQQNSNCQESLQTSNNSIELAQKLLTEIIENTSNQLLKTVSVFNVQMWQKRILQIKEEYNLLVERSTDIFQKSRKISTSVADFITSINLFLESEEMLVPLKEIQKGINDLLPEKVQKQMNYMIKIFETNFEELMESKMLERDRQWIIKIKDYQKANQQMQKQLKNTKSNEGKFLDSSLKLSEYQDLCKRLQQEKYELEKKIRQINVYNKNLNIDRQKEFTKLQNDIVKANKNTEKFHQKIKELQKALTQKDEQILRSEQQMQHLSLMIRKIKQSESEGIDQIELENEKKFRFYESKIQTLHSQIKTLQQNQSHLQKQLMLECQLKKQYEDQNIELKQQISQIKSIAKPLQKHERGKTSKAQENSEQQKDNQENFQQQQQQQNQQNKNINEKQYVSKQVIRALFKSFEDQSKEWAIRRNIRNQIYLLVGAEETAKESQKKNEKNTKPQQKEEETSSKWFGIF